MNRSVKFRTCIVALSTLVLGMSISRGGLAQPAPEQASPAQAEAGGLAPSGSEQPSPTGAQESAEPEGAPLPVPPAAPAETPPRPQYAAPSHAPPGYPPPGYPPPGYPPPAHAQPFEPPPKPRPVVMDYSEGQPVPPGYTVLERRRKGLIIAGSIVFGISYGISLSIAAGNEYSGDYGWLALPVFGPLIASTQLDDCSGDDFACEDNATERGFLMLDSLTQAAGATMLILGLAVKKKVLVQNLAINVTVRPAVFARHSQGLKLHAQF